MVVLIQTPEVEASSFRGFSCSSCAEDLLVISSLLTVPLSTEILVHSTLRLHIFFEKDSRAGLPESVIQSWLWSAMQSPLAAV